MCCFCCCRGRGGTAALMCSTAALLVDSRCGLHICIKSVSGILCSIILEILLSSFPVFLWPDDEDINTIDISAPTPVGSLTRARARQLNLQVSSVLNSCQSYLDNGDTCTFVLLRNNGQDQQGKVQLHSEFEATPTLRADCIWEE